ncbi:SAV_6107 family HEPN domain-containing protein [Ruania halotolerans]|uniref:SAV_6107 family HEPN domain-containing protein n=1 Tax=Ruania halotolerans TaxID=2897773 RepID=UPI001E5E4132|nr:SAV_6107 family HEPN domain-containing protein [Ruania halotolerans]UFU05136.1 colicin transporter [Ruania halotolerans]
MVGITAAQQLRRAELELGQIEADGDPRETFVHAHMAALRAGAAVLALHPAPLPSRRRRSVRSVWEQLAECGTQWESWAAYFAQGASIRAAIETDRDVTLTPDRVEEAVAAAADFVAIVTRTAQESLPMTGALAS